MHGITGLRVDGFEPGKYADSLGELIDKETWNRMSANARNHAMGFDVDRIVERYVELIRQGRPFRISK